ncbi:hypothetical protein NQ317_011882 [Molorchus minor]|uniref:Protein transport protein sec16 n=1 Tax=Molorchus minor TaxID=1323400 RepID=A0ABQ9JTJ6_9CUCU|nr:hypothetical protein NQ317_011882 [Molorchus minor]
MPLFELQPYLFYTSLKQTGYNQNIQQQHYGQPYQHQPGYYQNNTAYDQQPYGNLQYNNQHYNQNRNNSYQGVQQTGQQNDGDSWDWGWGDEDNSNVQATSQQQTGNSVSQSGNNLGDAFSKDEAWSWGTDDAKQNIASNQNVPKNEVTDNTTDLFPKVTGKRGKLDTPQWSTESQISQESSDDVLHTSESDKSHMMSRSSTISHSPLSSQDPPLLQNPEEVSVKTEAFEDLASNPQFENKEIISNMKYDSNENRSVRVNPTPPPPKNTQTPPLIPPQDTADESRNPYKRSAALSYKSANKFRTSNTTPPDTRQFQSFHNQQVNLETLPDNSEQPDPIPSQPIVKTKPVTQWPDNNEAPINDRNQYLETGQLSGVSLDYNHGSESGLRLDNDTLPPPGLRRMIPGQMEQSDSLGNAGNFGDEPPPGLSRMVLGQTEAASDPQSSGLPTSDDIRSQYEPSGPPVGLHRMIPGESSSPESTIRGQQQRREDNDSESEFDQLAQHNPQPRSATIGADTPPALSNPVITPQPSSSNRSETIGGGDSAANNMEHNSRRDSIEGQTQENDITNVTNSIRNLTVGENITDGHTSNTSLPDTGPRRLSRQESSDSDQDLKKLSRGSREKKSLERSKREKEREREKYRYSPDNYKDNRYDRRRYRDRRFEEDTDFTEVYSDKEKTDVYVMKEKKAYDRKYNSLRKDKDKDRRRRDPREYGRDRRGDYYYNRYDDDYANESVSRPTSRSDSMHESFRDRGHEKDHRDRRLRERERERDRYRRQRDPREMYNPYQGYAYDTYNPYYQQYQYYENLRRTNPQAYAEWYRKYYQQATTGHTSSYGGEDRASVHSGRSSANDDLTKDRYTRQSFYSQASMPHLGGYYEDTHSHSMSGQYGLDSSRKSTAAQRLTPAKFSTAHVNASIASGRLLRILPHYPMDGQNATVEICNLQSLLARDEDYIELSQFPGPLVNGVTHKKTIIEYCEGKIRRAAYNQDIIDVDSYVLMWELLILLIRQNGMVVGTDIAELLLKNKASVPPRPSSALSSISSIAGDINPTSESSNHLYTEKRTFLLYGSGKEALEWAMKHGLWGHALFLASKLDKRTYANIMMRFANGLTLNDPLQTLYQLLSGKMPAAVTCVADEKWGDWRPHLAMILSNHNHRPELNRVAITTLGDTLKNRGSLYAAQFCYLMAEVGFSKHDDPNTRLALLGADHGKPFPLFASNEAMHMTEIYEYACGLNDAGFIISEFQIPVRSINTYWQRG